MICKGDALLLVNFARSRTHDELPKSCQAGENHSTDNQVSASLWSLDSPGCWISLVAGFLWSLDFSGRCRSLGPLHHRMAMHA
jgi:hypothetical protein